MSMLETSVRHYGRKEGASPAENKFYTLIMFDISNRKKYSLITKLLKRYSELGIRGISQAGRYERAYGSYWKIDGVGAIL